MVKRYENSISDSPIKAVVTMTEINECGEIGPRLMIQRPDYSMYARPIDKIADFLNYSTGKNDSDRVISKEVEQGILNDFKNVLNIKEEKYVYTGPKFIDKYNLFKNEEKYVYTGPKFIDKYNLFKNSYQKLKSTKNNYYTNSEQTRKSLEKQHNRQQNM